MILSALWSIFESNARPDSVFTEHQLQPIGAWRRSPHDLRFVITNKRFHSRHRFDSSQPARIAEAGISPELAETLSALARCRGCPFDFDPGLVVLVARDNGDGRVLQLSPSFDDCAPDWLCSCLAVRRRISRSSCAGHSLPACSRTTFRGRVLSLRNEPLVPNRARLLPYRCRSFLGDNAIPAS